MKPEPQLFFAAEYLRHPRPFALYCFMWGVAVVYLKVRYG